MEQPRAQDRKALDATAFSEWIAQDVSLVMQAAIRSIAATLLLLAWAQLRGIALFQRDGTLRPGLVAGLLFAGEFVLIYAGLAHTNVSRMSVFIYLAPRPDPVAGRAAGVRRPVSRVCRGLFLCDTDLDRRSVRRDRGRPVGVDHRGDPRHAPWSGNGDEDALLSASARWPSHRSPTRA